MKRTELEIRRALLYAPLPPRTGRGHGRTGRPPKWTRARALAALATLDEQPTYSEWERRRPPGMPAPVTLHKLFGSWNAAMEAAGWKPRPRGRYRNGVHVTGDPADNEGSGMGVPRKSQLDPDVERLAAASTGPVVTALTAVQVHALLFCLIGAQDGCVLLEREPGSDSGWIEVLPTKPRMPKYAIWKATGAVHTIGSDGAVSDDPVWVVPGGR